MATPAHLARAPIVPSGEVADVARRITLMPDAIVVVDHTSTIMLVNVRTERLFGYTRDELLGTPVDILVPGQLRSAHQSHRASYFRAAILPPVGSGIDLYAAHRDGPEVPVEISLSPLDSDAGALVIYTIRDVTAQRTAQRIAGQARQRNHRSSRPSAKSLSLPQTLRRLWCVA